ncbi:hypothetical protein OY671_007520 [Metschnikowia pulcherrima]|nr:hypothetical protein OY671_007520 [Metschnikowia pulcherrima]
MKSTRSALEDWISDEVPYRQRANMELEEIYYGPLAQDDPFIETAATLDGACKLSLALRAKSVSHYPDCAPSRQLSHRIDTSLRYIGEGKPEKS